MKAARRLVRIAFTVEAIAPVLAEIRGSLATTPVIAMARRIVKKFGEGKRPRIREVAAFLNCSAAFRRVILTPPKPEPESDSESEDTVYFRLPDGTTIGSLDEQYYELLELWEGNEQSEIEPEPSEPPVPPMIPAAGSPAQWEVPAITTLGDLAAWLGLDESVMRWLRAEWRADHETRQRLAHYRFHWVPRRGRSPRLIEAPLPLLKRVQQRILHGILDAIPAHPSAHGFVKGRGTVSFARPHTRQRCVLRMDIQDFFPTIRRGWIVRIFLTAGYPEPVAEALASLCTTRTPTAVLIAGACDFEKRRTLRERHLPQGAPTSPALANLCAFALDSRLAGLARKLDATYSRYADDMLFSGGESFRRSAGRCEALAGGILLDEGFSVAHRKTKIMASSVSQRAAGLVLNDHPAVPRRERDILKAILTNCIRHGIESQNRSALPDFRAHLEGRIAHVAHVSPAHGAKLRELFEKLADH